MKPSSRPLAIYFLFFLIILPVKAQNARLIAKNASPSVVMLVMADAAGQQFSLGSGFFVSESIVATSFHVIANAHSGFAKLVGKDGNYNILGTVGEDQTRDLVLVELETATAPPLVLGKDINIEVGDEVYVLGNPEGLEGTLSHGIVSSVRQIDANRLIQITAPISPGSSGGPVLNNEGKVIGIAAATFKEGQNLNFALPVEYLISLLSRVHPRTPLSELSKANGGQSIFEGQGSNNTEAVTGKGIAWYGSKQYDFSIRNMLNEPIKNVKCLVIFYGEDGNPIDFKYVEYSGIIPPSLAKLVAIDNDNWRLWEMTVSRPEVFSGTRTKVEVRILDFSFAR